MGNCFSSKDKVKLETRNKLFDQMTIFQATSTIISNDKNAVKFKAAKGKKNIKKMSDASSAIRESYIATN